MAEAELLAQGMTGELIPPDWPPLTLEEVRSVLARFPAAGEPIEISWRSPRPMSAAGLVRTARARLFVKRQHYLVRDLTAIGEEHDLAAHLRTRGVRIPAPLRTADGATAISQPPWTYEVHESAPGEDRYRDTFSWQPYHSPADARAAGVALARLHLAAEGHPAPPRPWRPLLTSAAVSSSAEPWVRLAELVRSRPALWRALRRRNWEDDFRSVLAGPLARAAAHGARLTPLWTHGDWHPSNLTWEGDGAGTMVVAVLDLGCANRTSAAHDLAMAIERSAIGWLELEGPGGAGVDYRSLDALLGGYTSVRPLGAPERRALPDLLPVVHVEYALSELEYFAAVIHDPANADLAYSGYLLGHSAWFSTGSGNELLEHLRSRL